MHTYPPPRTQIKPEEKEEVKKVDWCFLLSMLPAKK